MKLRNAITSMTAATLVAASMNLFAASDGSLAATSSGTTVLSLSVPNLVQISGLANVGLTGYVPGSDSTGSSDACVYSNAAGNYYVTLTSTSGAFNLTDGSNTIPYAVTWDDTPASTPSPDSVVYATKSGLQAGNASSTTCGGTPNASLAVTVNSADMAAKPAGSYSDTITILVSPT